jgi:hypothetical protein
MFCIVPATIILLVSPSRISTLRKGGREIEKFTAVIQASESCFSILHDLLHYVMDADLPAQGVNTRKNNYRLFTDSAPPRPRKYIVGREDYIRRGQFDLNVLTMDMDIKERLEELLHYSKLFVLDYAIYDMDSKCA